jgi:DNA helicase-2/ATP-dependent DNA helicase PcrA
LVIPFEDLEPKQQGIIKHEKGSLLILAGPGTGKTEILTQRVAYLISKREVQPEKILAITFSRKAAGEMKNRLSEFPGLKEKEIHVSTLHAEALQILKKNGDRHRFLVADDEGKLLIKDAVEDIGLTPSAKTISTFHNKIALLKASNIAANEINEQPLQSLYQKYEELLDYNKAIDLDGLIMRVVRRLRSEDATNTSPLEGHILVDEYQDVNQAEHEFIKILASKVKSLFVVGDDDQSIYGWRGADPRIIRNFTNDFNEGQIAILEKTHRCSGHILNGAYSIVSKDPQCIRKTMCSAKGDCTPINVVLSKSWIAETFWITDWIRKYLLDSNLKLSDIVILAKPLNLADYLYSELNRLRIRTTFWKSGGFLYDKDVLDILAHIRFVLVKDDNLALRRSLSTPLGLGIGDVAQKRLRKIGEKTGSSLWEVIVDTSKYPDLNRWKDQLKKFEIEINTIEKEIDELTPELVIKSIAKRMGTTKLANVGRLSDFAKSLPEKSNCNHLLAEISKNRGVDIVGGGPKPETEEDAIAIMSLHSAKGLGYKIVFVLGMDEGIMPDPNQDEFEQRRLCYVAMTRAKNELFLCHSKMRKGPAAMGHSFYNPSRFLSEIPATCRKIVINN